MLQKNAEDHVEGEKKKEYAWKEVTEILGERPDPRMEIIMGRKLKYFGHQVRKNGMAKALIKDNVEGDRGRGRPAAETVER